MSESIQEQGGELKVLSNGAVYDYGNGKIAKGAPLSSAQASALAHSRWARVQAGFIAGGIRALDEISPSQATEGGVIEYLAEHAYRQAVKKDDRAGVEWARFYAGGAGLLPDRSQADGGGPAVTLTLSQGAVESLAGLLGGVIAASQVDASGGEEQA
jgi:hypothetical protein